MAAPEAGKGTGGGRASFFDVDNTLIRGDTQEMEGRILLAGTWRTLAGLLRSAAVVASMALHRAGLISTAVQNRVYLTLYRGRTREELEGLGQALFDRQVRTAIFKEAHKILEARRAQGDLIVLVSASTSHLLRPLEEVFRPDKVFCTDLAFDQRGRATGAPADYICICKRKAELIRDFARAHHLDLSSCRAYSDHHSDLPMLNSVGHPEVINPTPELECHARSAGWPIHRFA